MQTSIYVIISKTIVVFLLSAIFQINASSQTDTITKSKFDNTILKSGCSRFISNAFSLPKGKMIYASLYALNGHFAYGLKKDLSIEAGFYILPYNDEVFIAGVKFKKSFYITDHLAVALKPGVLSNDLIKTGFVEGILSYEIKNSNISVSYARIYDLGSYIRDGYNFGDQGYMYGFLAIGRILKNLEAQYEYSYTESYRRKGYLVNIGMGFNYYYKKIMIGAGYVHFATNSKSYFTDNIPLYFQMKLPIIY